MTPLLCQVFPTELLWEGPKLRGSIVCLWDICNPPLLLKATSHCGLITVLIRKITNYLMELGLSSFVTKFISWRVFPAKILFLNISLVLNNINIT